MDGQQFINYYVFFIFYIILKSMDFYKEEKNWLKLKNRVVTQKNKIEQGGTDFFYLFIFFLSHFAPLLYL